MAEVGRAWATGVGRLRGLGAGLALRAVVDLAFAVVALALGLAAGFGFARPARAASRRALGR